MILINILLASEFKSIVQFFVYFFKSANHMKTDHLHLIGQCEVFFSDFVAHWLIIFIDYLGFFFAIFL